MKLLVLFPPSIKWIYWTAECVICEKRNLCHSSTFTAHGLGNFITTRRNIEWLSTRLFRSIRLQAPSLHSFIVFHPYTTGTEKGLFPLFCVSQETRIYVFVTQFSTITREYFKGIKGIRDSVFHRRFYYDLLSKIVNVFVKNTFHKYEHVIII